MANETPFMKFWSALNEQARERGYPEPTFGPAHRAWDAACEQAFKESFAMAWKAAA